MYLGKIISFADDTALLFRGDSRNDSYSEAQKGFGEVFNWLSTNKFMLNINKTKFYK